MVKYKIWDLEITEEEIEAETEAEAEVEAAVDIAAEAAVDTEVEAAEVTVVDPVKCMTQLVQIAAQLAKFHLPQLQAGQFTAMLVFLITGKTAETGTAAEGQVDTAAEGHATLTGQAVDLLQAETNQQATALQATQATTQMTAMIQLKKQHSKNLLVS